MGWDYSLENWLNASGAVSLAQAEGESEQIKPPCLLFVGITLLRMLAYGFSLPLLFFFFLSLWCLLLPANSLYFSVYSMGSCGRWGDTGSGRTRGHPQR